MNIFNSRYIRQIILPEIGFDGQIKLRDYKVLCIGIGGLGSPVLMYLASMGIGTIGIVDMDVVKIENLQRQVIFNIKDIGKPKVNAAMIYINNLNPLIKIVPYFYKLKTSNIDDIISKYDIVVDCTDNIESKYLINEYAVKYKIPMVYGSVFSFEGYVSVFRYDFSCYSCLHKNKFLYDIPNCNENGILGAICGVIGAIQAIEVVKLCLDCFDISNTLISKLFIFNFKKLIFNVLNLDKKEDCQICGMHYNLIKHKINNNYNKNTNKITFIDLYKIKNIDNNKIIILNIGKNNIKNSKNFYFNNIIKISFDVIINMKNIKSLIKNDFIYIIICDYGIKSKFLCDYFRKLGYNNIYYTYI